jgi:SH3 domain-containing YSC84-like protein 1
MSRLFRTKKLWLLSAMAILFYAAALPALAQRNQNRTAEAGREAREAARVFNQIMAAPDNQIPRDLLNRAHAIAVFPGVTRVAFGVGGRGGDGVVSRRTSTGWSAPAFFNLGGGSIGAQIGASRTDYVFLFMNEDGLRGLLEDRFEMGGEAGVAAGPVGRAASASTNLTLDAAILSYSRSRGAYIGAAVRGVVITPDNDLNRAIYNNRTASQLLAADAPAMSVRRMPAAVRVFPQTLTRFSARRR